LLTLPRILPFDLTGEINEVIGLVEVDKDFNLGPTINDESLIQA